MNFIKTLHVFFLFAWIGQLLASALLLKNSKLSTLISNEFVKNYLKKMCYRWMLPCMIASIGLGLILLCKPYPFFKQGWFHAKLTGACGLIAMSWLLFRGIKRHQLRCISFAFWGGIFFLFATLAVIYMLRDKEAEWRKQYGIENLTPGADAKQ